MKPQPTLSGHSSWNAWQQQRQAPDRMQTRVHNITRELEAIQNEIFGQFAEADGTPRKSSLQPGNLAPDDLARLKAVVDQMRRFLWFYVENLGGMAAEASAQQAHRLQRATALLNELSPQDGTAAAPAETGSFFDRLNVVIDSYMQPRPAIPGKPNKP